MIDIRNLTVQFGGVRGLNDLTADIGAKITGLVGPNGAGKTTLLNVMSGFVRCSDGTVMMDGQDLLRIAINRRAAFGLRRTFQTEQVVENLTVWNNVAAALDNVPTGGRGRRELITEALDYVGLTRHAGRVGASLNASERRLVEIARCIVGQPRLVMMDEPGAGLSESEADHLRKVIVGIPGFCGAQVLLVDHDVDLISATCEETLVLDFGSKIAFGRTAEVLKDPKVRAAYLGTIAEEAA
ncbi:MAG: ATP-binding cassette domain-containing protein [Xanthobacteraceae bacterium]